MLYLVILGAQLVKRVRNWVSKLLTQVVAMQLGAQVALDLLKKKIPPTHRPPCTYYRMSFKEIKTSEDIDDNNMQVVGMENRPQEFGEY